MGGGRGLNFFQISEYKLLSDPILNKSHIFNSQVMFVTDS